MSKIELTGRAGAVFSQDGRTMELDGELMASGSDWVLYGASVGRWSDGAEATPSEKNDVIRQVVELLSKEGVRVLVE